MSQSLIVFEPSGRIKYQYNNKISPFNDLIYSVANDTATVLDENFYSLKTTQRKLYVVKRDQLYAALYFDTVTSIDNDKIRNTLSGILKTVIKLDDDNEKLAQFIELQFNELMQSKVQTKTTTALKPNSNPTSGTSTPKKVAAKKMRRWNNGELMEADDEGLLDYSESREGSATPMQIQVDDTAFSREGNLVLVSELQDILDSSDEEETNEPSGFFSKLGSYFGTTVHIDDMTKKFTDQLVSKNIHPSTAKTITDKLRLKLGANSSVSVAKYKEALIEELTKILTPNVSTDLLYEIKKRPSGSRPYVVSVVGVNGVGKSTNLAKLAYWFLQNNLNVLICACDTFRSGAVEQLKVHVDNLLTLNENLESTSKIELFEKGYGGGDHVVTTAKLAIGHAQNEGFDIVLIDTAGRTHSNARLMTPLKKFGDAADPDKIIMVGEALVGTDSVEQAINFNNAFGNRRNLDFFIISKVDTVGDLVGTMINMVMATKVPILFMGTGQTYTDIKRLNVKHVVDMLMS